jgi:hypothetical protein
LVIMRRQAKAKPGTGVVLRGPASSADRGQYVVVALRVLAEVLLDAQEHRGHDLLSSENEEGRELLARRRPTLHDYKFARPHMSLKNPYPRTPVMAAGKADHVWTLKEVVALLD